jgi:hypothetical protein
MNYSKEQLLDKLKQLSYRFNINETEFVESYIGLIDNDMISSLTLTDADKIKLDNLCFKLKYDKYNENGLEFKFDFEIGRISPIILNKNYQFKNRILRLFKHFENVICKYKNILSISPSRKSYTELLRKFNTSINYINQHFKDELKPSLSYAIEPNNNNNKRTAFKSALYYNPLLKLEYDNSELLDWKILFMELEKKHSIEWIKNNNSFLYNKMIQFHINEKIVVHGQHCSWLKKDLANVAKSINSFLSNKKYNSGVITNDNINIFCRDFNKYTKFGKKKNLSFNDTITIGDVCIRCICLKDDYIECNTLFNLSNVETYNNFKKCFSLYESKDEYDDDGIFIQDPVNNMFERLESLLDPSKRPSIRTCSKCPKCEHVNTVENKEAIINSKGDNPLLKHPSDVMCGNPLCNYEYCTDCKLSHPGFICRGFPEEEDTEKDIESCPACGHTTHRIGGCTCMTCEIPTCRKTWCWLCRCLRYPEQNPDDINPELLHYCMDEHRYYSNINWVSNPDFKPYKTVAPEGHEDMDFVPA